MLYIVRLKGGEQRFRGSRDEKQRFKMSKARISYFLLDIQQGLE